MFNNVLTHENRAGYFINLKPTPKDEKEVFDPKKTVLSQEKLIVLRCKAVFVQIKPD